MKDGHDSAIIQVFFAEFFSCRLCQNCTNSYFSTVKNALVAKTVELPSALSLFCPPSVQRHA